MPGFDKIVDVISFALVDDQKFSEEEALKLISPETVGPLLDVNEHQAIFAVYQNIVRNKINADEGVEQILLDKLREGYYPNQNDQIARKVGNGIIGAGVGTLFGSAAFLLLVGGASGPPGWVLVGGAVVGGAVGINYGDEFLF